MTGERTGRATTLSDFENGEAIDTFDTAPLVILQKPYTTAIRVPDGSGTVAGHTGIDSERGRCYISIRKHARHFFRKYDGYAISTKILNRLQNERVEHVVIWVSDNDITYEWPIQDWLEAEDVDPTLTEGDMQKALPLTSAAEVHHKTGKPVENRL